MFDLKLAKELNGKYIKYYNNGSIINFSTSFRSKSTFGNLAKIANEFNKYEGSVKKHIIVNTVSDRYFKDSSDARGYYSSYFAFLSRNNIIKFNEIKKTWEKGSKFTEYMHDVNKMRIEN